MTRWQIFLWRVRRFFGERWHSDRKSVDYHATVMANPVLRDQEWDLNILLLPMGLMTSGMQQLVDLAIAEGTVQPIYEVEPEIEF